MEDIKKFIVDHKKELGLAAAGVFIYRLGFRRGYNTSINSMCELVDKMKEVIKF